MTPSLICQQCSAETPLGGETTTCRGCGREYKTAGLSGAGGTAAPAGDRLSEKQVERSCIRLYRSLGFEVWKTSQPQRAVGMSRGLPDLVVLRGSASPEMPAVLFHEVKRPGGRMSEAQERFRDACLRAGLAHVVGGPGDAADVLGLTA